MGPVFRKKKEKVVTVRMEESQYNSLSLIAKQEDTRISDIIRGLIDYYLKEAATCKQ